MLNIDALLSATANLEHGHPVEDVLKQHGFRMSAYQLVSLYQKDIAHYENARSSAHKHLWAKAIKELEPVIKAIEKAL